MAIFMVTGDIKEIPKKYRDLAIKTREDTQEYSDEGDNVFVEFFRNKFPEYNDLTYLITPQEVFLLKDDKLSEKQKSEIISRSKGCALINNKLLSLQELHEFLDDKKLKLEALNSEEITELKGQVGCKGYAEGKVCLIQHKDDILKLEKGEILVTEMTSPEFVPAMKKASAIITDEGGVTSHAAIASRELNKPCVIGTKFATQVLKDGDEVEVDAEKGIVKILKKN
ncbi:hypothetical protein KAI32_01935 [Candidatus Pacearchaeota archaeon]|nr:hypothetical protein [Candidatus Pacearchaeota archaeon]